MQQEWPRRGALMYCVTAGMRRSVAGEKITIREGIDTVEFGYTQDAEGAERHERAVDDM